MGSRGQSGRPPAAPRRVVSRRAHLLQPHRRARRESPQRPGGPPLSRDPVSPARALEYRTVRAARDPAGGPAVPAHLRRVPELPSPAGIRRGCEGAHLRPLSQERGAGVGRALVTGNEKRGASAALRYQRFPCPVSRVYSSITLSPTATIPTPSPRQ